MAGDKVLQVSQIGIESTPGTAVAADTILHAVSFGMAIEGGGVVPFRPEGYRANVLTKRTNREMTNIPVEMIADYRSLAWIFSSLLDTVTPVQQGATIAWKWTWTFDPTDAPTRTTFTVERGDASLASEVPYVFFHSWGLTFNREDYTVQGGAMGALRTDGVSLTGSPTEISAIPILAEDTLIYLEATEAALAGATALTRVVEVEWHLNNAAKGRFSANADASFSELTELAPEMGGTMKFWKNAASMAFAAAARAGTKKFLRIKTVGPLIADTYYQTLQITCPIKFTEMGNFGDDDDAVTVELPFVLEYDETSAFAAEIELTTDIDTSYAVDV